MDRHGVLKQRSVPATSNPGNFTTGFGGVARNVAENLARLGRDTVMVSLVGDDEDGRAVAAHLASLGADTSGIAAAPGRATASYTAILEPDGELVIGFADMDLYDDLTPARLAAARDVLETCDVWFADANLPAESLAWLARERGSRFFAADAVSVPKAARLIPVLHEIAPLFLNRAQAAAIGRFSAARCGVATSGARGAAAWCEGEVRPFPPIRASARDVTGAGDALIAGTLYRWTEGGDFFDAVRFGMAAAAITVESPHTVAPHLTAELVYERLVTNLP